MAWIGLIILAFLLITTFILGVFGGPSVHDLFMAFVVADVVVPVLFFIMIRVARILEGRGVRPDEPDREQPRRDS